MQKLAPLSKWFFFAIVPALCPLVYLGLQLCFLKKTVSAEQLFGRGELLLACCAFAAAGLGDLIASGRKLRGRKWAVGGCCFVIVVFAVNTYADVGKWIEQSPYGPPTYNAALVAWFSVAWCAFAILCGAGCLYLAETK